MQVLACLAEGATSAQPSGRLVFDFERELLEVSEATESGLEAPATSGTKAVGKQRGADCYMQLSSGFEFDDGNQLLVSMQKPLGLLLEELHASDDATSDGETQGCVVVEVAPGSAADAAGVKAGYHLKAVNNMDVSRTGLDEVLSCIQAAPRVLNLRFSR